MIKGAPVAIGLVRWDYVALAMNVDRNWDGPAQIASECVWFLHGFSVGSSDTSCSKLAAIPVVLSNG